MLYKIKMKLCYDQGYNDIGVVIATKWGHGVFNLQLYFWHWELFIQNCSRELFPAITEWTLSKIYESVIKMERSFVVRNVW